MGRLFVLPPVCTAGPSATVQATRSFQECQKTFLVCDLMVLSVCCRHKLGFCQGTEAMRCLARNSQPCKRPQHSTLMLIHDNIDFCSTKSIFWSLQCTACAGQVDTTVFNWAVSACSSQPNTICCQLSLWQFSLHAAQADNQVLFLGGSSCSSSRAGAAAAITVH